MRVTLDVDNHAPSENTVMMQYLQLERLTGVKPTVRLSSRGRGVTLIARGISCSYSYSLQVRRMLGEDEKRLQFDEDLDHKPKQILWRQKRYKGKSHVVEDLDEKHVLALPMWISQFPRSYWLRRMRKHA